MEPGSDGGPKVNTCALATPATGPCRLPSTSFCERSRSSQGFSRKPENDLVAVGEAVDGEDVVLLRHGLEHLAELAVACSR